MNTNKEQFYSSLIGSERTLLNYRNAINSSYIRGVLSRFYGTSNLFDLSDLEQLWKVYSFVNLDETNIRNHRIYSAALMKYIRFLNNGEKYGQRIDSNNPKKRGRPKVCISKG